MTVFLQKYSAVRSPTRGSSPVPYIEAANKQIKYRFLYHKFIPDFDSLKRYVSEAVEDYNNRPHDVLGGLTPLEVLHGKTIDTVGNQQQIMLAKAIRVAENKKLKCCHYSF